MFAQWAMLVPSFFYLFSAFSPAFFLHCLPISFSLVCPISSARLSILTLSLFLPLPTPYLFLFFHLFSGLCSVIWVQIWPQLPQLAHICGCWFECSSYRSNLIYGQGNSSLYTLKSSTDWVAPHGFLMFLLLLSLPYSYFSWRGACLKAG